MPDPAPVSRQAAAGADAMARAYAWAETDRRRSAEDPWYAIRKGWVLTLDEHPPPGIPAVRPLPPDEYLREITQLWRDSDRMLLAKSRQMRISWVMCWLTLWDSMSHPGRHGVIQGKRLDDVSAASDHSMLGRVRFIRKHLPPWLQPPLRAENTTIETYANGSVVEAIPEGAHIVRGKVPSSMFMDEIAFMETSEANWNAANPSAGKLCGVTTPNGHEFLYRQADPGRPWDDLTGGNSGNWPQIATGLHSYRNAQGIQLVGLHYTAHPDWRTPEWQMKMRSGYTNARAYLRERELDFTLVAGLGVYAEDFSRERHVIPRYVIDPTSPIYRGWDFGYNGQAVSFWQQNLEGQMVWFDQILLKSVPLPRVIQEVRRRTQHHFSQAPRPPAIGPDGRTPTAPSQVYDYGDPSARAHNTKGETDMATLSKFGIKLVVKTTSGRKADLVDNIRQLLLPRSDGKPGMLVAQNSADMDHVIAGFAGGYHYDEPKEGKAAKEIPAKDGTYDHIFDCGQYAIDNISPIRWATYADTGEGTEWWKDMEPGIGSPDYAP